MSTVNPRALMDIFSPTALRVAATLRLADLINAGATTIAELADRAGANRDALRRLMQFLVARGVFAESEPGRHALTEVGRLLLDEHPARLRAVLDLGGASGRTDLAVCAGLLDAVRTGKPSYGTVFGVEFWDDLAAKPELAKSFNDHMAAISTKLGPAVAEVYDWSNVAHVADVGGGTGRLLTGILKAHPALKGTLVDLPETVADGVDFLAAAGLADRTTVVGQSFFDPLPAGADVYVLSQILHDWDDEESVAIMRRCAEAAGPDGRVLVVERVLVDDDSLALNTEYDLRMLVFNGGRERGVDEFHALAARAGLSMRQVLRTPSFHFVIEFAPVS